MNNLEELTSKARIERLKGKFEIAKSYGSDQLTVPMPDLSALIAQLEAAQKRIKELESKVNHYVAAEYAHKHFDQTAEIIKRADSAELELVKVKAELSAANEKLNKPVVLPAGYSVRAGHPINESERYVLIPKEGGRWLSRFDVEHALRVAGIAVEGE